MQVVPPADAADVASTEAGQDSGGGLDVTVPPDSGDDVFTGTDAITLTDACTLPLTSDAAACPPCAPTFGQTCTTPGLMCDYTVSRPQDGGIIIGGGAALCTCNAVNAGDTWSCILAGGPLMPPDLAT